MKHFTLWKFFLLLCALVVGSNVWAQSDNSAVYTSNVTLSTTGGTNASSCKVEVNSTQYDGIKCGTGKAQGAMKLTVPAGTKYLHVHVAGWNGESVTLSVTPNTNISPNSISLTADSGISDSSPFTLSGTASSSSFYKVITFTNALTSNTELTFTATSGHRFVIWGVNSEDEVVENKVATPSFTGTEKFLESTEVTIICGTEDADIQYSTDGGTNWSDYSAPFTLTETTTVTAKATKDGLTDSDPASKTFTKITPMTVAEAIDYIDEGENLTGQYVTGKISQIDSYASGAITYWISDDGTTTGQMEVYKGKGLNSANFSAVTDLNVGDVVTVYGTLQLYGTTYEFSAGSSIIARTELPASDITKTADVTLDFKNGATDADLTDYFTTSSTGAITYTVDDETIIENAEDIISALKVGTTTVTVSQAATLYYKAGEITINVTVQDTREAATTIPAINISTLKVGDAGTISVTNPVKADDGVTFAYTSSDDDVLIIVYDEYEALTVGTVTVTVTAIPSNTNLYKSVVQEFTNVMVEAAVKTDNAIVLDAESGSTLYGTPKSVNYEVETGYDGVVAYTIDNAAIADVEIGASTITFTPKATGTAVITLSAPATATFNAADDVEYTLTVTAPAGGTEALPGPSNDVTLDFTTNVNWNIPTTETSTASNYSDGTYTVNITGNHYFQSTNKYLMLKSTGSLTLPSFNDIVEKIVVVGKSGASASTKENIYVDETAVSTETTGSTGTNTFEIAEAYQTKNAVYTLKVTDKNAQITSIAISFKTPTITATLNASGYATFCSQYPLDFSDYATADYSAWQVTSIGSGAITFEQVKGKVKGGTGLLLKGEAGATVTLTSADSDNELTGNKLVGTLAPLYVAANDYYGLSGTTFVRMNAGTVKAGKAIIPAGEIPTSAQNLTFVFEDNTTGIESIHNGTIDNNAPMYNISGQRVSESYKGIVIVNGKKVVRK